MNDLLEERIAFFSGVENVCVCAVEDSAPSWQTDHLWLAAGMTLKYLIHRHQCQLDQVKDFAGQIKTFLVSAEEVFDRLCNETCTQCAVPCCLSADVYYDFRDLLFLRLTDQVMPPGQPRHPAGAICRYLGPDGCRMPRLERPWICTWYLCARQKRVMNNHPGIGGGDLQSAIAQISILRKQIEALFIDVVS